MTPQLPAISVREIRKSYGDLPVLRGVSLEVSPGAVFALLGSNGAGKTTLVKILATLIDADGGRATVAGADVETRPGKVREQISLTGQFSAVDEALTGSENLVMIARLRHLRQPVTVALVMGFRSQASTVQSLTAVGIVLLFSLALAWVAIIAGLTAKSVEGASAFSYPIIFLPFLSSAFVPTATMPVPVRWFAERQPATALVDCMRNLLLGHPAGTAIWSALAWCSGVLVVAWVSAGVIFHRRTR